MYMYWCVWTTVIESEVGPATQLLCMYICTLHSYPPVYVYLKFSWAGTYTYMYSTSFQCSLVAYTCTYMYMYMYMDESCWQHVEYTCTCMCSDFLGLISLGAYYALIF